MVSVGVKTTPSDWCWPGGSTVPAAGVYVKVPGTFAVALSWVAPSGVPSMTSAGLAQVMTGVAGSTSMSDWTVTVL